jgi:hypothetical protein
VTENGGNIWENIAVIKLYSNGQIENGVQYKNSLTKYIIIIINTITICCSSATVSDLYINCSHN